MKFCFQCGATLKQTVPDGDNRLRFVCTACDYIHYQNPKLVVGSIPLWLSDPEPKVLLCRRAIQPRLGYWTLPAGFMENDESTKQAALRETLEEAGAHIELQDLFSVVNVLPVQQVHLFYRAQLLDLNYAAGEESLELALFTEREIPWDEIAFPSVFFTLEKIFADLEKQSITLHHFDIHHGIVE